MTILFYMIIGLVGGLVIWKVFLWLFYKILKKYIKG